MHQKFAVVGSTYRHLQGYVDDEKNLSATTSFVEEEEEEEEEEE